MKIHTSNKGYKFIDQELYDHINQIWLNYDVTIPNDNNIYFTKNTNVNKMVTDYADKGYQRVLKPLKADYVVIQKFNLEVLPQYMDLNTMMITEDDTKEIVYPIYNLSSENQLAIDDILGFVEREQEVKYVNQDRLNESLNNGFIIDKTNYTTIKELIDSEHTDNHILAINMIVNSDLKANWEWVWYICLNKGHLFNHDKKNVFKNYFTTLGFKYDFNKCFSTIDIFWDTVKNNDVLDCMENKCRQDLVNNMNKIFSEYLKTTKLTLDDVKIRYRRDV